MGLEQILETANFLLPREHVPPSLPPIHSTGIYLYGRSSGRYWGFSSELNGQCL